jgi:hypothetical protein
MIKPLIHSVVLLMAFSSLFAQAEDKPINSPQAGSRSYLQNYKDMVLAECVATAYKNDSNAAVDAGSSVSALRDWSYYDFEQSIDKVTPLIKRYLARDYKNPLVESEIKNIQFNFLKCLDLYHSDDLEKLAKKVVINPKRSYRQDHTKAAK